MQLQKPSTDRSAAFRRSALSLGEELFDRIEVRGIERQVEEPSAGSLDALAYRREQNLLAKRSSKMGLKNALATKNSNPAKLAGDWLAT